MSQEDAILGRECTVCTKRIVRGDHWLLLNRYAIGFGDGRCLSEARSDEGYVWEMDGEYEGDQSCTGWVLHWPVCAGQFVDGMILKHQVEWAKRQQ